LTYGDKTDLTKNFKGLIIMAILALNFTICYAGLTCKKAQVKENLQNTELLLNWPDGNTRESERK
jgi:hypothetical protein